LNFVKDAPIDKTMTYNNSVHRFCTHYFWGDYSFPERLEQNIGDFVKYFNYQRYHEALDNLTPVDVYYSRSKIILDQRAFIKEQMLKMRKQQNLKSEIELDYVGSLS